MNCQCIRAAILLGAILSFVPVTGQAALLDDFGIGDGPMLLTQSLLVAYDVDTGTLSVRGLDVAIDDGSGPQSVFGGGITMTLSVDDSGVFYGGTFEVTGTVESLGFNSGMLLNGDITAFGWPEPEEGGDGIPDPLQFGLNVVGGDAGGGGAGGGYFGLGALAGIVALADFPGDWTSDWANDGNGTGMAGAPIPIPATLWLMFSALFGLGLKRRTKS